MKARLWQTGHSRSVNPSVIHETYVNRAGHVLTVCVNTLVDNGTPENPYGPPHWEKLADDAPTTCKRCRA